MGRSWSPAVRRHATVAAVATTPPTPAAGHPTGEAIPAPCSLHSTAVDTDDWHQHREAVCALGGLAAVRAALTDAGERLKGRTGQPYNHHPQIIRQAPIERPAGDSEDPLMWTAQGSADLPAVNADSRPALP